MSHSSAPAVGDGGIKSDAATPVLSKHVREHPSAIGRRVTIELALLGGANIAGLIAGTHPAVRIGTTLALVTVPGLLILRLCGRPVRNPAAIAVIAGGLSLTVVALIGLVVNTVGRWSGVSHPLSRGPLLAAFDIAIGVLIVGGLRQRAATVFVLPTWRQVGWGLSCLLVPLLALAGSARLNAGAPATVAVLASIIAGAALVVGFVAAGRIGDRLLLLLLGSVAAALIVSYSTRGAYLFGYDVQEEFGVFTQVHHLGTWQPSNTDSPADAYSAMLSITILPQVLVELCRLTALDTFRVVLPLMLMAAPATAFGLVRSRLSRRAAFAVAAIPALLPQFINMMPAVTRQSVALAIFGALLLVLMEPGVTPKVRTSLAVLLSTGVVVSHYSTAYITLILLTCTWAITSLVRLCSRGRWTGRQRVTLVVVGWLGAFCLLWNVGLTHSVANVGSFVSGTAKQGFRALPTGHDHESIAQRWLLATVSDVVSGPDYANLVAQDYRARYPWMQHYSKAEVAAADMATSHPVGVLGALPQLRPVANLLVVAVNQLLNLAIVVGVVALVWSVRRRRDAGLELPLLAAAALAVTAVGRVSGAAIESYNPDRLYMQTIMVLVVGLAHLAHLRPDRGFAKLRTLLRAARLRPAALGLGALAAATIIMFANSTQLLAYAVGGGPSPNFANVGEGAERYLYTDRDVAAARWAARSLPTDSMLFVDRYGVLPLWSQAAKSQGVFSTIAPSAVDPRGYVLLTEVNTVDQRARGFVGRSLSVFRTPVGFYDENKDVVYSTGATRIYR